MLLSLILVELQTNDSLCRRPLPDCRCSPDRGQKRRVTSVRPCKGSPETHRFCRRRESNREMRHLAAFGVPAPDRPAIWWGKGSSQAMSPPACPKGAGIPSLRGQPDCDPPFPLPVSDVSAAPAAPKAARPADLRRPTDRPLPSRRFAQGAGFVPRGASGRDQPLGRGQGNLIHLEPDHLRLVGQTGEKSASSGRDGPPCPIDQGA